MIITTTNSVEARPVRQDAHRAMANRAQEVGATAVIVVSTDHEVLGRAGRMLMVTSSGTGVQLG